MKPAYHLNRDGLDWLAERNSKWRARDGRPHITNIAFAADIVPSVLTRMVRGDVPLSMTVEAHLVVLAMEQGATEAEARDCLFHLDAAESESCDRS